MHAKADHQPDDTAESPRCDAAEEGDAQRECDLGQQLSPGRSGQAARAPHRAIVARRGGYLPAVSP